MPPETYEQLLDRAAALRGIDPGYWDIWGKYHAAQTAVKQAILASAGISAGSAEELERALAERKRREWTRLVPASLVASQAVSHQLPISVPAELAGQTAAITIEHETGQSETLEVKLADVAEAESTEIDGRRWIRKPAPLPADLPLGYYRLTVRVGAESAETRYIVTPDRAWNAPVLRDGTRAAGISVSLYGLRSTANWGCGDFRDLRGLIDWAKAELHASFVGLNPLHAIHNRRPFNTSPYLPNCIFYQNFLYLDVERIEDFQRSRRALRCLNSPETQRELAELRAAPFVEYERVAALKLRFLKLAFLEFLREWRSDTPRACGFREFRQLEGRLLERFATYCALDEYLHRGHPDMWTWRDWPAEFQDPDSPATREFQSRHWRS
ncbi:MAG TPA: 4-alpha-glucanotransferase, partial [Bryobacteraceae bacterium]